MILKETPVVEAPVVFTLSMSLSPTFSAMTLCLIDFIGLLGGVVALLETVARFLLFSIAHFPNVIRLPLLLDSLLHF